MRARDIMTTEVITVREEARVHEIVRLLLAHRISAVPVVDDQQQVVGIVSEGDLLRSPEATVAGEAWWLATLMLGGSIDFDKVHASTASEVMTRRVIAVDEDASLSEIARLLERRHIKRVPVLRNGRLVGIVSRANLLHGLGNDIVELHEPGAAADRGLRVKVLNALRHEPLLAAQLINVTVQGDAVKLWGVVDDDAARAAAERAALSVDGVEAVENNLGPGPVSGLPV